MKPRCICYHGNYNMLIIGFVYSHVATNTDIGQAANYSSFVSSF